MDADARKKVAVFLALTAVLALPFYVVLGRAGSWEAAGMLPVFGVMWAPAVAALVTRLVFQRNLRGVGWRLGRARYVAAAYLLPVAIGLVVYGLAWATGLGGFSAEGVTQGLVPTFGVRIASVPLALLFAATAGVALSMTTAMGEEIGWRGLLVPELARVASYTRTALLSGAIWVVYHLPLVFFAGYHSEAPLAYGLLCFIVLVMAGSFIFAWLRLRSGSVWPAVLLHASHNLFVQAVFDPMTVDRGPTEYVTTEFGAGLAAVYVLVAWACWRRRAELPQPTPVVEASPVPYQTV